MFFYVIELEITMHYISKFISLTFYEWLIIRHEFIISLYLYLLQIEKTSNSYSYLSNIRSKFMFGNIRIRIHFKIMETDMGMALSYPFQPLLATARDVVGQSHRGEAAEETLSSRLGSGIGVPLLLLLQRWCRCLFDGTSEEGSSRGGKEVGAIGRRVLGRRYAIYPTSEHPAR
jgi:hypothetical protein